MVLVKGYFFKGKEIHNAMQDYTDGAIAWYYTAKELSALVRKTGLTVLSTKVYGQKTDILPLPAGKVKKILLSIIPNYISRFITNSLRQGFFLVLSARKD